jgi:hypothetical protein
MIVNVTFGPCCFCAKPIETTDVDPCGVTVETRERKWQVDLSRRVLQGIDTEFARGTGPVRSGAFLAMRRSRLGQALVFWSRSSPSRSRRR